MNTTTYTHAKKISIQDIYEIKKISNRINFVNQKTITDESKKIKYELTKIKEKIENLIHHL